MLTSARDNPPRGHFFFLISSIRRDIILREDDPFMLQVPVYVTESSSFLFISTMTFFFLPWLSLLWTVIQPFLKMVRKLLILIKTFFRIYFLNSFASVLSSRTALPLGPASKLPTWDPKPYSSDPRPSTYLSLIKNPITSPF